MKSWKGEKKNWRILLTIDPRQLVPNPLPVHFAVQRVDQKAALLLDQIGFDLNHMTRSLSLSHSLSLSFSHSLSLSIYLSLSLSLSLATFSRSPIHSNGMWWKMVKNSSRTTFVPSGSTRYVYWNKSRTLSTSLSFSLSLSLSRFLSLSLSLALSPCLHISKMDW